MTRDDWESKLYDPREIDHRAKPPGWEPPEVGVVAGRGTDLTLTPGDKAIVTIPPGQDEALLSGPGWSVRIRTTMGAELHIEPHLPKVKP